MDTSDSDDSPRVVAPRPIFMSQQERDEYDEIHTLVRERRENNVRETEVLCRFYNMSNRDVDVIWCRDKDEEDYIFSTVPPKRYFQIRTFQGHPWIFRAAEDGERMDIHKSEQRVHYPYKVPCKQVRTKNGQISLQVVFIKSPKVESSTLKQLCIRQLSRLMSTDSICDLKFPVNVMSDILEYQINKIAYVNALNPKKIADEKVPAVKTVDYLQKLMTEIETQECQVDLREKLKNNLNLFSSSTLIESMDEPSTSGLNDVKRDEQLTDLAQNRKRSANKSSLTPVSSTIKPSTNDEQTKNNESVPNKKSHNSS